MSNKVDKEKLLRHLGIWYITWMKEYSTLVDSATLIEEKEGKQAYGEIETLIRKSGK